MNQMTRLVFFIITLFGAFGASFVVYNKMTTPRVVVEKQQGPAVTHIAVATREMQRGAKITAEDVRLKPYLQETVPQGHFASLDSIVGRIVLETITLTEPILESALAPTSLTKGGMAAIINPKKRAMAVKVDNVIGVAGFLQPGHLVDVLVSISQKGQQKHQVAKTVLENIQVLSVGTQAEDSNDKRAKSVTVVTLEVDLDEGEKLALAVNEGQIQLALRGYSDTVPVLTRGNTMDSLLKSYSSHIYEPVAANEVKPVRMTRERPRLVMEMMNGNNINRITLDR